MLLLTIAAFFGVYETNLGNIIVEEPIIAVISGEELTQTKYDELKKLLQENIQALVICMK